MDETWKDAARLANRTALGKCAKIVCEQTNCCERGFDDATFTGCAFCADIADSVVGTYLAARSSDLE
jgi:hypothetical protein